MKIDSFDDYQKQSRKTWNLIHTDHPIVYPTLGLTNEAGEVAGKVKKIFRDKNGVIGEEDRQALKGELRVLKMISIDSVIKTIIPTIKSVCSLFDEIIRPFEHIVLDLIISRIPVNLLHNDLV